MSNVPIPQADKDEEKELKNEQHKWSMIEESIYKQKSRVQWIKLGDLNTKYFLAQMKGRKAQNQITMLIKKDSITIIEQEVITRIAIAFYTKLLGQTTHHKQGRR